jgi:hypothetical protein
MHVLKSLFPDPTSHKFIDESIKLANFKNQFSSANL